MHDMSIANSIKHLALKIATLRLACKYKKHYGFAYKLLKLEGRVSTPWVLDIYRLRRRAKRGTSLSAYTPTPTSSPTHIHNIIRNGNPRGHGVRTIKIEGRSKGSYIMNYRGHKFLLSEGV